MKLIKRASIFALLCLSLLAITACSRQPYVCDLCTQERTSPQHTSDFYGTEIIVCDECYKEINALLGN